MTVALLLVALHWPADPPLRPRYEPVNRAGIALHYHRYFDPLGRSMRQVAARRGLRLDPTVDGYASTARCDRIGWHVLAQIAGRRVWLKQVDCSARKDLAHQRRIGDVVEVDFSLADAQGWAARSYGGSGSGRAPAVLLGYAP